MPKQRNYTNEDVRIAVETSTSFRQVLTKLGLKEAGGNYASTQALIKKLGFDTSHFTGLAWNKGKTFEPKRNLEAYFDGISITSSRLRLRLIKEGYKEAKCEKCNLNSWLDQPIPLELDHINGDHNDNRLENLQILCCNCHAQTPTYRGKNKKTCKD